jgi:hypothetical protein
MAEVIVVAQHVLGTAALCLAQSSNRSSSPRTQKTQKRLACRIGEWPPIPFPFCDRLWFLWLLLCSD